MKEIKLSAYAKLKNRCYRTLWNHFNEGKLHNAYKSETGSIYIKLEEEKKDEYTVLYCRVSSHDQKQDLNRQIDRLTNFAINNGYTIQKVYSEVASGLNDDRIQLNKLLENDKITTIIVEHKDRLTRFGFNYIKTLTNRLGVKIIIVNESNDIVNDIMEDFISVITSFCARIYGKRITKRQTENIIKKLC
jgi:predicted site-specific integrase-resolvase